MKEIIKSFFGDPIIMALITMLAIIFFTEGVIFLENFVLIYLLIVIFFELRLYHIKQEGD